ncbi:FAD binding domain-containing protein [Ophiobolus disseminans]|uniref:FAD binding domain-containing protein n=1 Tax=Ophiobolus disseminans TaxID=1469910 RepID=A0A6A7A405_9PLEO|nr:FAD binding domain-containing protein [Ophiobolus disseminans]
MPATKMVGLVELLIAAAVSTATAQKEAPQAVLPALLPDFCCAALSRALPWSRLLFPHHTAFETRHSSYFNVNQQTINPSCIVQPRDHGEVALAVAALTSTSKFKPCKFAIRSGGHGTYAGASNIDAGVVLDLKNLNTVKYDARNNLVDVGPGATWNDVYTTLEPLGIMIAGGRSSLVGVGGLTLGGGISYFSPEHGFVCDNVVEFSLVLASGRFAFASKTSNPDLFMALKGGGNNFGVVISFAFRAFKYSGMWGGLVVYPETTMHDQFKALVNFANKIEKNPKGAAIVMSVYQSTVGVPLVSNAYDYAEPVSRPAAYDEFFAIPGVIADTTGIRNMSSIAQEWEGVTTHSVFFGTLTFANDLRVMKQAHEIFKDVLSHLKTKATGDWGIYTIYQPIPPAYWKDSEARGGNVLGFERFNNQALCLYLPYISWQGAEQDALFQASGAELIKRIRKYAESIGADNPFLYLNYADKTQDPLATYGAANVERIRAVAKKYDPHEFLQNLVPGGFKIANVS